MFPQAFAFVKNMVAQPEGGSSSTAEDTGQSFGEKFKQSIIVATNHTVTKLAPAKVTPVENLHPKESTPVIDPPKIKAEQEKILDPAVTCRVCLKSMKPNDISKTCHECHRKVCEDCACYSAADTDDPTWCCQVCRRKMAASRPALNTIGPECSLEVPGHDGLQRRHSDVRLNSQTIGSGGGGLGAGLGPPRSPDLRRHSDVSPASLKELERFRKVSENKSDEWRSKSRSGSPERHHDRAPGGGGVHDRQRNASPQCGSIFSGIAGEPEGVIGPDEDEERLRRVNRRASTVRRKSRVSRQSSYDDAPALGPSSSGSPGVTYSSSSTKPEFELGPPMPSTRRASTIAVYSTGSPGSTGLAISAPTQHRASISYQGSREPDQDLRQTASTSRRPSFRASKPYEAAVLSRDEKIINLDTTVATEVEQGISMPDEKSLSRRRASAVMLPNIDQIRAAQANVVAASAPARPAAVARVNMDDRELARQGSLADGEGIKIVIHDVDSDMHPRANSKKKVVLRKDVVMEKGHRTRSFGMRVVGGKIGSDKRLYAIIVWTVSGGPAEKAGLHQGDKVLEWGGVSLVDRPFEEVAHIIDRSGDVAEIVVEHVTDSSADVSEEPVKAPAPEKTPSNLGLGQMESDTSKSPSSPTRRKLPKTPV